MKRKMCQTNTKNISEEHVHETEVWSFLASAMDKKRSGKRKRPDMCRDALLQLTVKRLNDEITERCLRKTKKRKVDEIYDWKENGVNGWGMTNVEDDDECDALLGINSFLSELSKVKPSKQKSENVQSNDKDTNSTVLPSFSETFGRKRKTSCINAFEGTTGSNMASCRVLSMQPQISLVEQFDSLCC